MSFPAYLCPLCRAPLAQDGGSWRCPQRHSFDIAREGYSNFLPVQNKKSLDPGDNKEMVAARRRFLEAGYFAPISGAVNALAGNRAGLRVVDAGCGEGYYLRQMPKAFQRAGFDISKWAVLAAAKLSRDVAWSVASNRSIPFAPASVDLILSMFGFPVWESFAEILASGGYVLTVDPAANHLLELREIIYPTVNSRDAPTMQAAEEKGFRLLKEERLQFRMELKDSNAIQDLLLMTPHGYRISAEAKEKLLGVGHLSVQADIVLRLTENKSGT